MKELFDIEALKQIPIENVLELLGAEKKSGGSHTKTLAMKCFCPFHEHGDKNPSLIVWRDKNICKCMVNSDLKGDSIKVVMYALNFDFKQACTWLHENFGIPYKIEYNDEFNQYKEKIKKTNYKKSLNVLKQKKKECELEKKLKQKFNHISIMDFLENYEYNKLKKSQKLKLIYGYIYRYSLTTDHSKKEEYYKKRGIDHPALKDIGYLSNDDIKEMLLTIPFPKEDLIEFKILHPESFKFRYYSKDGFMVIPNGFELNNDLVNGLILRPFSPNGNIKEFQISAPDIVIPLPFGLNRNTIEEFSNFLITEGHIDALSIFKEDMGFIAVPGVGNIKEEWLCLLKGKKVYIAFDMDNAGIKAGEKLQSILNELSIENIRLTWDTEYKDLNDLLLAKKIDLVLRKL